MASIEPEAVIEVRQPAWIAASSEELWATSLYGVMRIDPETNAATLIPLSLSTERSTGLVVTETDVWIADAHRLSVFRVDRHSGELVAEVATGPYPEGLLVEDGWLWGFRFRDQEMFRIDPRTNEVVERIETGAYAQPALGSWWLADAGLREIRRVEPGTSDVLDTIPVPEDAGACAVFPISGVNGLDELLGTGCSGWPEGQPLDMAIIDPATNTVQRTVDVGGGPGATVIDGEWWIVQDSTDTRPGRFVHIDPETWQIDRILSAGPDFVDVAGTAGRVRHAVVAHDALWVVREAGDVLRFSLEPFRAP